MNLSIRIFLNKNAIAFGKKLCKTTPTPLPAPAAQRTRAQTQAWRHRRTQPPLVHRQWPELILYDCSTATRCLLLHANRLIQIAVGEPTQTAGRSPSLQTNINMSRKRSAPGATPASAADRSQVPTSLVRPLSATNPFEDYTIGTAPKLQRTASGRQPRHHQLRLQRPPLPRTLEHYSAPMSATSSNLASPFALSPMTPYEYTPPNSAFSSSFGQLPQTQQMMSSNMDRNDSLGGQVYHQLTQMNLSSSFDHRQVNAVPTSQPQSIPQQQFTETYELDPADPSRKYSSMASSPPIDIPKARFGHRLSNNGPSQEFLSTMPPPQFLPTDAKLSPTRLLAPRPSPDSIGSRSISSSPHTGAGFHQAPVKVEGVDKYQISRLERHRVEKQKLFCDKCNKQPDGFRGAHELQRHKDAQHSRVRKVWVCVDGSQDQTMLSNCKNCRAMKTYPAYYNAAAHLRRMHFKPKPDVSQRGKTSRAGIGGGDNPPIEILKKFWMKQVVEVDGKIIEGAEVREDSVEADCSSEDDGIKEEMFDEVAELDRAANEAAERAIPHLSSTVETMGSYVEVSPSCEFADFDYDSLLNESGSNTDTNPRSLQQNLCDSVSSAGNQILNAAQHFGDFDFSDMFPTEFFPSA